VRAGAPSTVVAVEDGRVRIVRAGQVDEATIRRAMEE
jgi:tRNA A37 threonylcarbamoyladenosine synthetase subunit TsaC/SUA5/YrdC